MTDRAKVIPHKNAKLHEFKNVPDLNWEEALLLVAPLTAQRNGRNHVARSGAHNRRAQNFVGALASADFHEPNFHAFALAPVHVLQLALVGGVPGRCWLVDLFDVGCSTTNNGKCNKN